MCLVRHNEQHEDHPQHHHRRCSVSRRPRDQCVSGKGPGGEGRRQDRQGRRQDKGRSKRRDEVARQIRRPALRNITAKWERGSIHWKAAMTQFTILYEPSRSRVGENS